MLPDLEFHVDRLYQVPPDEFTPARNRLAAQVKAAGDAAAAARIKALEKPSVSAWAVNQLYWRARPDFSAVVDAGDRLRAAQAQLLAGREVADFQDVFSARMRVVGRALKTIDGLAARAGVDLSPSIRRRVQTTIEAIASQGSSGGRPFDGRLTGDLTPPGFEALAALAAAADAARADAAAEAAERRVAEARDDVTVARRQLTDAMTRSTRALDTLKDATRARARTAAAREKAEKALQAARAALVRLQR